MGFNAIQNSFHGLQLLLNANKTKCMLFNRLQPAPSRLTSITTLDGSDFDYVDNYKYLGVWLDCKLSLQTHIKHFQYNKPMLGKALPYLCSLLTIAKLTSSTHSRRYISLVNPKTNTSFGHISFQFSAANDWNDLQKSLKLETYLPL
jgi:hypothetical protein